jgi:hypothetical protein
MPLNSASVDEEGQSLLFSRYLTRLIGIKPGLAGEREVESMHDDAQER